MLTRESFLSLLFMSHSTKYAEKLINFKFDITHSISQKSNCHKKGQDQKIFKIAHTFIL